MVWKKRGGKVWGVENAGGEVKLLKRAATASRDTECADNLDFNSLHATESEGLVGPEGFLDCA